MRIPLAAQIAFIMIVLVVLTGASQQDNKSLAPTGLQRSPASLFERVRADTSQPMTIKNATAQEEAADNDDDDDDDDDDHDETDDDGDDDDDEQQTTAVQKAPDSRIVSDLFGNKLKMENNRTYLLSQNKGRDFGMIAIKAIILGPLIGLTIKAALIRGLIWAVSAYVIHLFFPALLGALGLGSGLVGFARQMQPDYMSMLLPQLANLPTNLHSALPNSMSTSMAKVASQYMRVLQPVMESIRSIPEGHCRYRAVCETASYLIRSTQFMSQSLQRISATVYLNFGTDYSKAWLDGIVQSDCAVKYAQCPMSPFSMVATKLAEAMRPKTSQSI